DENGTSFLGNVYSTKYGWALGVQQSVEEAFEPLRKAQRFVVIVFIITIIIVVLIAWLLGKAIVKPIEKLTDAAERISVGELDVELNINSNDEIAALGRAIVRMQDSIRLSMDRFRRRKLLS
ncbi:MAG: HAMP domain-containing protein, partial [Desulfobacteraceae bacterium]